MKNISLHYYYYDCVVPCSQSDQRLRAFRAGVYLVRGIAVHQCLNHNTARKYPRLYFTPRAETIKLHCEQGIAPLPSVSFI